MRVGILGAGPAGTVCAQRLLHGAQARGQQHEVLLFDGKSFPETGPRGCNMCSGIISTVLLEQLARFGMTHPEIAVLRYLDGFYIETRAGSISLPKAPDTTLCAVFRGGGPRGEPAEVDKSFDFMMLRAAQEAGAVHIDAFIREVILPETPAASFVLIDEYGKQHEVDVLIGAFGVNSRLTEHMEQLGFGYLRPRTYHVSQAELPLAEGEVEHYFGNEVKILYLEMPGIHFVALTPKRRHISLTVIGPDVRPDDLRSVLRHPRLHKQFPPGWQPPDTYCYCHPRLPVSCAGNPVADRLVIIGDAHIARYLKGGIESAFFTGALAAQMVLDGTLSRRELRRRYVALCHARYQTDNYFGRFLFWLSDLTQRHLVLTHAQYWMLERETHLLRWSDKQLSQVMWHIFAGDAQYRDVVGQAFAPRLWWPMLQATAVGLTRARRGAMK